MKRFAGKRILFFQQRGWAINIGHHIATRFQEDGAVLGAITLKKSTDRFIREQGGVSYEYLISHDSIMEDPEGYLAGDQYSLDEICAAYGVGSVWPLVQSLRNYVKSYRDKYYYGFKQNVRDENIVLYLQAAHKMCVSMFRDFAPDVIIAPNFVAYPHIIVNLYGRRRGVRMIGVTDCKVRGMNIFTESYLDDRGSFFDRVKALTNSVATSENAARATAYISQNRQKLDQKFSVTAPRKPNAVLDSLRLARRVAASAARQNRLRGFGNTQDSPGPGIVWRDFWAHRTNTRAAESFPYDPFDGIASFAFMPLQFQPEANIDVIAPGFNNQIEAARQIAMSLPGDMTLVVKEHPAMIGYRPPSYLEKVARTPNVKLIDYRLGTQQILERAKIVIAATGTVFFEAALQRVPVIQLGDLGTTQLLPNVVHHADLSTLTAKVKDVLSQQLGDTAYERQLANYVSAAYDVGFDLNYFGVWERSEPGDLEAIYQLFAGEAFPSGASLFIRDGGRGIVA